MLYITLIVICLSGFWLGARGAQKAHADTLAVGAVSYAFAALICWGALGVLRPDVSHQSVMIEHSPAPATSEDISACCRPCHIAAPRLLQLRGAKSPANWAGAGSSSHLLQSRWPICEAVYTSAYSVRMMTSSCIAGVRPTK